MDNINQVFVLFLMGLAAIFALIFTLAASVVLVGASAKASRWLTAIDRNPALVGFGNTATGQYIHGQVGRLLPAIDSPDDKLIRDLAGLPILKNLYSRGIITEEVFRTGASKLMSDALGLAVGLLDGKESPHIDMG